MKKNKYRAKKTWYNGDLYDSKGEAKHAKKLDILLKKGEIKDWDRQIKIKFIIYGKLVTTYKIDFKVFHNDGSVELVEVKGCETDSWKIKWKLLNAIYGELHPDVKISLVRI